MFTPEHYIRIASVVRKFGAEIKKDDLIDELVFLFKKDNKKFDDTKFIEACFDDGWDG